METLRYTYLYEVISTGEKSEFSQMATSKEEAAAQIGRAHV